MTGQTSKGPMPFIIKQGSGVVFISTDIVKLFVIVGEPLGAIDEP